jgi:hypothetical protein
MTREDAEQLQQLAPHLRAIGDVAILSPGDAERQLFPAATSLPYWRWNLDRPNRRRFDLIVASNVFMYSSDPARWFRHVLGSCRFFLLLDLIRRQRSPEGELGRDGDRVRFALGEQQPRLENAFPLGRLDGRMLGSRTFHGGANQFDEHPLHLVGLFRGDLAEPVLRIDDHPTGVRPLLDNLSPLHAILEAIDSRGLPYYLGIVPALVDDAMGRFLKGLRHVIPAVHGFDHGYFQYAPLLTAKGDPYNQRTLGSFNEFKGHRYQAVLEKLRRGRRLLEDRLGRVVDTYISPGNRGDRATGRALVEAGYRRYLSEKAIAGCPLPWTSSDFYGASDRYDTDRPACVVTLHLTWEWDLVRQGRSGSLDRLLDHLVVPQRAERELGERLGAVVSAGSERARASS